MGLDQYVYYAEKKDVKIDSDLLITEIQQDYNSENEIAYWRKCPEVQSWMRNLYVDRGGMEDFNNLPLFLRLEDIDSFQHDLEHDLLPKNRSGFFWGNDMNSNTQDPDIRELTIRKYNTCQEFIEKSKKLLNEGKVIIYDSSW